MQHHRIYERAPEYSTAAQRVRAISKRLMDLLLASIGIVVSAPFMLVIAACIRLDSRGPVLYRQTRVGRGGQPFTLLKFRTMYQDADPEIHRRYFQSYFHNQLPGCEESIETREALFKMTDDPRITRVGQFLRRTSIDELPQVFNVIRGDMSLVGPRPPLPYEVEEYQEWHMGRLKALPGITGLWQVSGRSRMTFDEMVRMDLDYIARQSLWLDLRILLQTIPVVVSGDGAG